ncbi:hypothetical protein [Nocardiopsis aegyptia]|uniref:Vegetative cell wall protein gp1 n=1 Tax=Nocardiopsis aegyptia TaxID=220378 RepID=A0A7Z0EIV2_9ACTN|nr:hypothetical protein [Nocardiopsis aegyptia]NYJ32816.1 hypothetical protein [Nocardiopsis aegyptia]
MGKKLTDRWASMLALPGALYLAIALGAFILGQDHTWDLRHLLREISSLAEHPHMMTFGGQALLFIAVLAGSAVVGLVARGLGRGIERVWLTADWHRWPSPLSRWIDRRVTSRRRRWRVLRQNLERERGTSAYPMAYDRMARLSPEEPGRPTWCGDRIRAVEVRLDRDHEADLAVIWPPLWLVMPEPSRCEITKARDALSRATAMAAWALLYLPLALWWWPAAPAAATLAGTAWLRTRAVTDTYATLVEATVRLHVGDLAAQVNLEHEGTFSKDLGRRLTRRLRASLPPIPRMQEHQEEH